MATESTTESHSDLCWNLFLQQTDLIVLNDVHRVFAIDALTSSHPLSSKEEDIQTPAQISELFDAISYSKVMLSRTCFQSLIHHLSNI